MHIYINTSTRAQAYTKAPRHESRSSNTKRQEIRGPPIIEKQWNSWSSDYRKEEKLTVSKHQEAMKFVASDHREAEKFQVSKHRKADKSRSPHTAKYENLRLWSGTSGCGLFRTRPSKVKVQNRRSVVVEWPVRLWSGPFSLKARFKRALHASFERALSELQARFKRALSEL